MKLINWECLEEMDKLEDNSIDLIITDPPYNTIASKWDKYVDFNKFFDLTWEKLKPNWSIIIFASWSFTPRVMLSDIENYKYKYTWIKNNSTNFVHSKNRPMTKHEDILVFSKAPMGHISQIWEKRRMIYNPQWLIICDKTIKAWKGRFWTIAWVRPSHKAEFKREYSNYPTDVILDIPEPSAWSKIHTSQKPVDLYKKLILTHSNWWLIADFFMWSWTIWVAINEINKEVKRYIKNPIKWIWIELDETYFNIAKERIK